MKGIKVFLKEKKKIKQQYKEMVEYIKIYHKMRKIDMYNYKKLSPFCKNLLENHGKFLYFRPGFRKFALQTKSTVIPPYENFYA